MSTTLARRRALEPELRALIDALGLPWDEVSDLLSDQRSQGFVYEILGTGGSHWTGLTLAEAAAILDVKPEYLRTRLAVLNRPWFAPRKKTGDEALSVRRSKRELAEA